MGALFAVGIGCRRGIGADAIENAVRAALGARAMADIACVASIDAKKKEAGLRVFCERHRLPLRFFSADDISLAPNGISSHARTHLGVDGVCEPCALLASDGGRLVVAKFIQGGVTVAIAETSSKRA